jgi:catechol 2,3-dioxygenase-like lactoylglutathione lyase family enzyme
VIADTGLAHRIAANRRTPDLTFERHRHNDPGGRMIRLARFASSAPRLWPRRPASSPSPRWCSRPGPRIVAAAAAARQACQQRGVNRGPISRRDVQQGRGRLRRARSRRPIASSAGDRRPLWSHRSACIGRRRLGEHELPDPLDAERASAEREPEIVRAPRYPSSVTNPSVRAQPMISVVDVGASSTWYQRVLGATSGHGGSDYEQIHMDGQMILQLHRQDIGHHHGTLGDPDAPFGNGVAIWFEVDDFDAIVANVRALDAWIETDVHVNPNAGHRELWLRDPDGYLVVVAEP